MNKPHIVFDFDGTLVDSLMAVVRAYNKSAKIMRCEQIQEHEVGILRRLTLQEIIMRYSIPKWKIPFLVVFGRIFFRKSVKTLKLFDGIEDLLLGLKLSGYNLHILSSNSLRNLHTFFDTNPNIKKLFSDFHSSTNIFGKHKAIQKLINKLPTDDSNIIYIGDEVRDVVACEKVSVPVISVTWGFNHESVLRKKNPYIATTSQEVQSIIENGSL